MRKDLLKFLQVTRASGSPMIIVRPWILCDDGFKFSLQASAGHYCQPRETLSVERQSEYKQFELMINKHGVPELYEYGNDEDSVHGQVPLDVVYKVIDNHGGINLSGSIVEYIKTNNKDTDD